jgi:hypothetical protein
MAGWGSLPRVVLLASTLLAAGPAPQPRVVFTQVGRAGDEIGQSHRADCDAALPVAFPQAVCSVTAL